MVSQIFGNFLGLFNTWFWVLLYIIIFLTLALNKGTKRWYFLIVIAGFLLIGKFIEDFYVSNILILCWLLFMNLKLFPSTWVLIFLVALAALLGLTNPFFYIIVIALWVIILWHFVNATFGMLDPEKTPE
jgi:hypothetical protein